MAINTALTAWLVVYLLVVLGIGVYGWRKVDDHQTFATADRNLPFYLLFGSLFATFMSALTFISAVGYSSKFGFATLTLYMVGSIIGTSVLWITARKWHDADVNSVSEFMRVRYGSGNVQALMAISIVFVYAVVLIGELYGIGWIIEGLIGIPMWLGIVAIGLFFVAYTIVGGMVSVSRTDAIQAVVFTIGFSLVFASVALNLWGDPSVSFAQNAEMMDIFGGSTPTLFMVGLFAFVFGPGVAIHPYYVQRLLSAKNVKQARLAVGLTQVGQLTLILFTVVIGVGGSYYLPNAVGDSMAPAVVREIMTGPAGIIAMMVILAGIQSTTDSLLHVIGTYTAQDVIGNVVYDDLSDRELLRWSRISTGVFGVTVTAFATYQAISGQVELIARVATYAWGTLGAALFVPIIFGMYWRGATSKGAAASVVLGLLGTVVGHELVARGMLPYHEILYAIPLSVAGMVVVSSVTEKTGKEDLAAVFDDVSPATGSSDD